MCMHTHTHTHVCIHTHVRIHTHMYIYVNRCTPKLTRHCTITLQYYEKRCHYRIHKGWKEAPPLSGRPEQIPIRAAGNVELCAVQAAAPPQVWGVGGAAQGSSKGAEPCDPAGCPGPSPQGPAPSPSGREGHPGPRSSRAAWPSPLPWKRWWGARFPLIKGPVHLQWIFSGVAPVIYAT